MKHHLLVTIIFIVVFSICHAQNPILWGLTFYGGQNDLSGTIFNYNVNKGTESVLHNFGTGTDGKEPPGSLILASDGLLYGLTMYGGTYDSGTIFNYNISTGIETVVHSFGKGTDGRYPRGSLMQAKNGLLYGLTMYGGTNHTGNYGNGIIFSYNISTGLETVLYNFGNDGDGRWPTTSLIQINDSLLYGTAGGGMYDSGAIFNYNISSGIETVVYSFGTGVEGWGSGSLIQANNGLLYGIATNGGTYGRGTIFSCNISTGIKTDLYDFGTGIIPCGSLILAKDSLLYGLTTYGGLNNKGIIFSYNISEGLESVLHNFSGSGTDGQWPYGSLFQASNDLLYGTTAAGGIYGGGSIFNYNIITTKESVIHNFGNGTDGVDPLGSLIEVDTATIYITPVAAICAGSSTILTVSGGAGYTWSPATGLSVTTGDSVLASPTVTTTYTVIGTSGVPTYPTIITVTVNSNPTVTVNTPSLICNGDSATLNASGATNYIWTPSIGLNTTTGNTVIANPSITTIYNIIGTTNGCSDTTQTVIMVNPHPIISITRNRDTLTAFGASTYAWNTGSNYDTTIVNKNGKYIVTGIDSNGCSDTASYYLIVSEVPEINKSTKSISLFPDPSDGQMTVTLNGNGYNSLRVYNEIGQEVYEQCIDTEKPEQNLNIYIGHVPSGIYIMQLISNLEVIDKRIIISRK